MIALDCLPSLMQHFIHIKFDVLLEGVGQAFKHRQQG